MLRALSAGVALATAAIIYFLVKLFRYRNESSKLPGPPMSGGKIWGHLPIAEECAKRFPSGVHVQVYARYIQKKCKLDDIFYVDWWPFGPRFLYLSDPELATQYMTTGQSLPKSHLEGLYLNRFLGEMNMLTVEGPHWKALRSIFNPGFASNHLMTLVPYIVDATTVFYDILDQKAQDNQLFALEECATMLTIDIIGKAVLDIDFNSQKQTHPIVTTFRKRVETMPNVASIYPWEDIDLLRPLKLYLNERKLNALIGAELDKKLASSNVLQNGQTKSFQDRKRTTIDLAVDAFQEDLAEANAGGGQSVLRSSFRKAVIDSVKTFIFAGHDTTASTVAYVFYLLHFRPSVYRDINHELDTLFGKDTTLAQRAEKIKSDPFIINKMEYITAVLKETLRVFPPASTIRQLPPQSSDPSIVRFITDPKTGTKYPMEGWDLWPMAHLIGRNEKFFPDPTNFIPERFIPSRTPFPDSALFTSAGKDAWRAFEKGPRACIGQELAMIESKIILALIVRDFDFEAEYNGVRVGDKWTPIETLEEYKEDKKHDTIEGHKCYQILKGAAKPKDGMPGRLYRRDSGSDGRVEKESWKRD